MRRHLPWILTLLLCLPVFALAAELERAGLPNAEIEPAEIDSSLLFFHLADDLADATGTLSFEYWADGALMAREDLRLPGQAAAPAMGCGGPEASSEEALTASRQWQDLPAPAAVELLARHPQLLTAIQRRADAGSTVEVRITFDGRPMEGLPLGELTQRSGELVSAPVALQVTASGLSAVSEELLSDEPVALFAGFQPSTCTEYCHYDYLQCQIGCNGNPACDQQCTDTFDDCIAGCEPCSGPTVRTYTVTTNVSQTFLGITQCLTEYFSPHANRWHDYFQLQKKHTTYRETTQCDGSQSTIVQSVSYSTTHCWHPLSFSSCSVPQGTAFPPCF